jgi:hypothetical protein
VSKIIHTILASLVVGSMAYATIPPLSVTVSDASGKAAYKGATDSKGTFATATLKPGNYVVEFNSRRSPDVKGNSFALVVSAGKKKVTADSVAGEKFAGGGVAMRIEVKAGLNIAGQVTNALMTKADKNGEKLVWIPQKLGSNLPSHWANADSTEAREAQTQSSYSIKNLQDVQNRGASPRFGAFVRPP